MLFQTKEQTHILRKASRLWGIQPSYKGVDQNWVWAPNKTLVQVLSDLSETQIQNTLDLQYLIDLRKDIQIDSGLEPCYSIWFQQKKKIQIHLPDLYLNKPAKLSIRSEDKKYQFKKEFKLTRELQLPSDLPVGYHQLFLQVADRELSSFLICAPKKLTFSLPRSWGSFLPLYALRTGKEWGIGSFAELDQAKEKLAEFGAKWVGLLPMLAGNFEPKDCDPSPYSALSRLFWNEIYLDVDSIAREMQSNTSLRKINSESFQNEIKILRDQKFVDYHSAYQLKKNILFDLSKEFFRKGQEQTKEYQEFQKLFPDLDDYTHFRTKNAEEQKYHAFVQYKMHQSLSRASKGKVVMYMDYPVGVNDAGFDFHKYQDIFFKEVSVGAPPEPVFQLGQDWGFPSYHPFKLRESGYKYVRRSMENHMRYSKILRLDHVMGLHRVYVVPKGYPQSEGVYLRYKPEEQFAIACLEADKHQVDLIGENLGTVPDAVNEILQQRKFKGMAVGQFLFDQEPEKIPKKIEKENLVCVNTHDMPMFSSFLSGEDLDQVADLGIMKKSFVPKFKSERMAAKKTWFKKFQCTENELVVKMIEKLAQSKSRYLIVNPEDLWNEKEFQNIPGTYKEVPNWRRKFKLTLGEWFKHKQSIKIMNILKSNFLKSFLILGLFLMVGAKGNAEQKVFAPAVFQNKNTIELNLIEGMQIQTASQYFLKVEDTRVQLKLKKRDLRKYIFSIEQNRESLRSLIQKPLHFVALDSSGHEVLHSQIQLAPLLDEEFIYNGQLGVVWTRDIPTFYLWAPTAQNVRLHIYDDHGAEIATQDMAWKNNVWSTIGIKEWKNKFYLYEVKVYSPILNEVVTRLVTDPYSVSLNLNSEKSQIVQLQDADLTPVGWQSLKKPKLNDFSDIVIYESHLRDLTAGDNRLSEQEKGSYLALTNKNSSAYQYLESLAKSGLTHLHLLPLADFGSVSENRTTWKSLALTSAPNPYSAYPQEQLGQIRSEDSYNWGYDPVHFMVPDGSYSTAPNSSSRIFEFRKMVQSLNQIGIRLIMDVVFNHTYTSGDERFSVFDKIVPLYFYRLNSAGELYKTSCCPDVATENAMVEKLILDSIIHWAKVYKVDGFRFDLMNMHTLAGMTRIKNAVRGLTLESDGIDGRKLYIYGEAWPFGSLEEKIPGQSFQQVRSYQLGIGVFNDRMRDAIRGGTTSSVEKSDQGFATGLYYRFNREPANQNTPPDSEGQRQKLLHLGDVIKIGLAGNLKTYKIRDHYNQLVEGGEYRYRNVPVGYAAEPTETINYVSAHDGTTLWDAVQAKFPLLDSIRSTNEEKIRSHKLMLALVMFSQGIPFIEGGSDLLKSKSGDVDSYDSGDWFNQIDWTFKSNNWGKGLPPYWRNGQDWNFWMPRLERVTDIVQETDIRKSAEYFQALLKVRASSKLFHLGSAKLIKEALTFPFDERGQTDSPGFLVMQIQNKNYQLDSERKTILIFFNASTTDQTFYKQEFQNRIFSIHTNLDEKIDFRLSKAHFDSHQGLFSIPAQTAVVFEEKR